MLRFQIVFIILLSSFRTATHLNAQHWVEVDPSIAMELLVVTNTVIIFIKIINSGQISCRYLDWNC